MTRRPLALVLFALVAGCHGGAATSDAGTADATAKLPGRTLTIELTGNGRGELDPCG